MTFPFWPDNFHRKERLVLLLTVFIFVLNFLSLSRTASLYRKVNAAGLREPGMEFAGFKKHLVGKTVVGFLTDKNMSPENNDGQFLKAQYALAPVVLDLGESRHRFLVLDCSNILTAFDLLQQLNAEPVEVNPFNKIFAQKP